MNEASKSSALPHRQKLYDKYLHGRGIDIGCGNDLLQLDGRDIQGWDVPQGDAQYLFGIPDETFDFVHSSHCLEHMVNVRIALANWARVAKPGGIVFVTVPEWTFYERRQWPSMFNGDHKQIFTTMPYDGTPSANAWTIGDLNREGMIRGLVLEECFLELNNYDFAQFASRYVIDQTLGDACAQMCVVWRKAGTVQPA
jgi:SAM-dependent methyltransferase